MNLGRLEDFGALLSNSGTCGAGVIAGGSLSNVETCTPGILTTVARDIEAQKTAATTAYAAAKRIVKDQKGNECYGDNVK